jgi:hypothetical protein
MLADFAWPFNDLVAAVVKESGIGNQESGLGQVKGIRA